MAERTAAGARAEASWLVPAAALGTIVLLDVLRVWMPSVIFIYGRAGSTPATQMGAFAFLWVLAGIALAATARLVGPRTLFVGGGLALAIARLGLQLVDGGDAQLYVASAGWVAAMVWASGAVAGAPDRRQVAGGIAVGLVGDAALRSALHSVELTWVSGLLGLLLTLLLLAGLAVTSLRAAALAGWSDRGQRGGEPAWPWLGLGPLLVLYAVLVGVPARATIATDLAPGLAAALIVASLAVGLAWAASTDALPGPTSGLVAALLVVVGTVLALPADGPLATLGQVLLGVGIGGALGVLPRAVGTSGPSRRALVTAASLTLLFVVGFLYYASYDVSFGVPNRVFLVASAVVLAALTAAAGRRAGPAHRLATGPRLASGMAALVVLAGLGAWSGSGTAAEPGAGFPVRAVLYNLHMGYDTRGRFDTAALAAVVAAERPDVVVLNEVDRGWFLNGSHDVLQLVAEEVGMPYVFAPAADEVWGNAILSRYPLSDVAWRPLPQGDAPMARSVLSAVATLPDGTELGVVATHLHHVEEEGDVRGPQADVVAGVAAELAAGGRPVVVMGDMNAPADAPELAGYTEAGLVDALAPLGPVLTFPSWAPERHIDQVFTTPDLVASDLSVPASEASDHLAVAVTLERR